MLPDPSALAIVIPAHYACAGVAFFCAVVALVGYQRLTYRAFSICCLCVGGTQIGQAEYYTAQTVEQAAASIKLQTGMWLLVIPQLFLFIGAYTRQVRIAPWYAGLCVVFGVLVVANWMMPVGLRFESLRMADPLVLPWGETLARFQGESTAIGTFARLLIVPIVVWAAIRTWRHYRAGYRRAAILLGIYLALQVASMVHGRLIDHGILQSFYSAGFAFMALMLVMSVNLLLDLVQRSAQLKHALTDLQASTALREAAEHREHELAFTDTVTGLPNRNKFREEALRLFAAAHHEKSDLAILLLDLDHFRHVNDALGHDVGNGLLRQVAGRLTQANAGQAFLANLGGDGFIAMLNIPAGTPAEEAEMRARALASNLQGALAGEFAVGTHRLHIAASVGIAFHRGSVETGYTTFKNAEMAMYEAKARGRRAIRVFQPQLAEAVARRLRIQDGLRAAQQRGELVLEYQPVVAADLRTASLEALVRWHSAELGRVSPAEFVPIAEQTGDIHPIGAWVLDTACAQIGAWTRSGVRFGAHVAVNISPWQLMQDEFVAQVQAALVRHGIQPGQLMLEVTESALLFNLEDCIERLHQLRDLGIKVALDDFGTGYSSLHYLHQLPLDTLKIDRTFIVRIGDADGRLLVGGIVNMAAHLGLSVVAEGVETAAQCDILRELGCHYIQGYFACPPVGDGALRDFLARSPRD
ncbi:MAG: EAL domain-containing protein [Betaproteobacteria bacterium]|nr:EAL domain-containing protein [Betaproteobacteria bacterium]